MFANRDPHHPQFQHDVGLTEGSHVSCAKPGRHRNGTETKEEKTHTGEGSGFHSAITIDQFKNSKYKFIFLAFSTCYWEINAKYEIKRNCNSI